MKDYIEERTAALAHYIIETGSTVRKTAAVFHVSKSTVHTVVAKQKLFIQKWRNIAPFRDFAQFKISL